jgi:folylpolyglutamate synthase/dihydropteroate synthase
MSSDPLTWLFGLEVGIKFGLDSIAAIVAALGHPERSFATVRGRPNSKGSVTAMVDTALRRGLSIRAVLSSSHDLTERFVIDRHPSGERRSPPSLRMRTVIDRLRDGGCCQPTFLKSAPQSPSSSSAGLPWRSRSASC